MKRLFITILFAILMLSVRTASCQITLDSLEVERLIDLIEAYETKSTQLDTLYKRYKFQDEVIYQLRLERREMAKEMQMRKENNNKLKRRRWFFGAGGLIVGILVGLLI